LCIDPKATLAISVRPLFFANLRFRFDEGSRAGNFLAMEAEMAPLRAIRSLNIDASLINTWDEGEEWACPDSKRVPASDGESSAFEELHHVVAPDLARKFYRRVNGMTHAEWELDLNHPLVKFFDLQCVFLL